MPQTCHLLSWKSLERNSTLLRIECSVKNRSSFCNSFCHVVGCYVSHNIACIITDSKDKYAHSQEVKFRSRCGSIFSQLKRIYLSLRIEMETIQQKVMVKPSLIEDVLMEQALAVLR